MYPALAITNNVTSDILHRKNIVGLLRNKTLQATFFIYIFSNNNKTKTNSDC